jgi:hypothetical protein
MTTRPYRPGDQARMLYQADTGATVLGVVTIDRVVRLGTGREWRIEATRPSLLNPGQPDDKFPQVHATVDRTGKDRHGYVEPYREATP